jgi:hypothetical protein
MQSSAGHVWCGVRTMWANRAHMTASGLVRQFLLGMLVTLTVTSSFHQLGLFLEQWDDELYITPDAVKTNLTCHVMRTGGHYMTANMTRDCESARHVLAVQPFWRALYKQGPQLPTYSTTWSLAMSVLRGIWASVIGLAQGSSLWLLVLVLGLWSFVVEPGYHRARNVMRDRFNKTRGKQMMMYAYAPPMVSMPQAPLSGKTPAPMTTLRRQFEAEEAMIGEDDGHA